MFSWDRELGRHLAELQPFALKAPAKRPARKAKTTKSAGVFFGTVQQLFGNSFGFLKPDAPAAIGLERGADLYFKVASVTGKIAKGCRVSFDIKSSKKAGKVEAVNVTIN